MSAYVRVSSWTPCYRPSVGFPATEKTSMGETYRIEIRIKGSNVDHMQIFRLYVTDDFSAFKLQEVVGAAKR